MPEKWFTCPICGKQFSLKVLLMGHMRSHKTVAQRNNPTPAQKRRAEKEANKRKLGEM